MIRVSGKRARKLFMPLSTVFLLIIVVLSCGKNIENPFQGEGFNKDVFRVMAVVPVRESQGTIETEKQLLVAGRARGQELINNYILVNCRGKTAGDEIRKALPLVLGSARLGEYDCVDRTCSGFVDFDISLINKYRSGPDCTP